MHHNEDFIQQILSHKSKRLQEAETKLLALKQNKKPKSKIATQQDIVSKRRQAVNRLTDIVREEEPLSASASHDDAPNDTPKKSCREYYSLLIIKSLCAGFVCACLVDTVNICRKYV
jgi:hypothetical protein